MAKDARLTGDARFLGLDFSTQGLKATLIDSELSVVYETGLNFDSDLPQYGTQGGAHQHQDGLTVTSPAIMWVAALDVVLERMRSDGCALGCVAAISGSCQQHGSVWLTNGARDALKHLDPGASLSDQLAGIFSVKDSPIWMDFSTTRECEELERALGGAQKVADLTGSRAYERFTGNQIARMHRVNHDGYEATERIALVSSFAASLLIGDYAPIDVSDGSGMNLMNIRTKAWDPSALDASGPGLEHRLGHIVPSHAVVGRIHPYYVERCGFAAGCAVVAFSGDNPNSLAGLRLEHPGDVAISLGTSDTEFGSLLEPQPSGVEGHIFVNPVDPEAYMAMVVRKNGSLTREFVRDACAGESWDRFSWLLEEGRPGNGGCIGFYLREPEITPPILTPGIHRFTAVGGPVESFDPAEEVRAVVEGQFLAMRLHGRYIGLEPRSILATGGASANKAVVRIMADVFGVPVYVGEQPNSASLGAAYRALHGWRCARAAAFVSFSDVVSGAPAFSKAADPDMIAHRIYMDMLGRYRELEQSVMESNV